MCALIEGDVGLCLLPRRFILFNTVCQGSEDLRMCTDQLHDVLPALVWQPLMGLESNTLLKRDITLDGGGEENVPNLDQSLALYN